MKAGMEEVDYSKCNLVVYSEMVNDVPHLISLKQKNGKVVADTLFTYDEQNPLDKEVMASVISQTVIRGEKRNVSICGRPEND